MQPPSRRREEITRIFRLRLGDPPQSPLATAPHEGEPKALRKIVAASAAKPRNGQDRSLQSILLCAANPQTPSRAGVPDSAGNLPEQIQKTCDVLCPTVGDGVLDVPDGHINDCTFAGNLPPQKIARTT